MNEIEQKLQDAQEQAAVESVRADQAETSLAKEKARADAAEGERDELKARIVELEKARADAENVDGERLKNKITVLSAQVAREKARADAAESPENIRRLVKDRVELERKASVVLGDARLDEMTDRQVMATVVEKLHRVSVEGKSDDYVRARFDSAIEAHRAGSAALEKAREAIETKKTPETRTDSRSARQRFLERENNAWKPQETR